MVGNIFLDPGKAGQTRSSWILVQNLRFSDFLIFLDFWDPETPDSFRRFGSHVAALGELLPGKCSYWVPLYFRFSSKKWLKYWFLSVKVPLFLKNLFPPFVHLRPVKRGFCVSTHTPGELLDFRLLDFGELGSWGWGNRWAPAGGTWPGHPQHQPLSYCIRTL